MLPRFKEFLDYSKDDTREDDAVKLKLVRAADYASDGYEMCKRLEDDAYWDGSSVLCELCEDFLDEMYRAHREVVKEWVKQYGIKLNAKLCSRVRLYASTAKIYDDCELAEIDEEEATVSIYCPALHVRAGTGCGILHQIHPFESKFWEPLDAK